MCCSLHLYSPPKDALHCNDFTPECEEEVIIVNPIGYYIDTNIPVIKELERRYGSELQELTNNQKMFLISELSQELDINYEYEHPLEIYDLSRNLKGGLSEETDMVALLKALVNSL